MTDRENLLRISSVVYLLIGFIISIPMSISYVYSQWFIVINLGWSILSIGGLLAILFAAYLVLLRHYLEQ